MELLSPGIVLAAYAEPLLEGRRVVVFGDGTSALSAELVERGARTVHVYDPETSRAAVAAGRNRSKQISVVPLDEADVAIRDGAFDVAIVEDLCDATEPAALLKRVRRALSQRGVAIVASPNAEARRALVPRTGAGRGASIGYYELYDAVAAEFPEVRMLGQTPFVGYAIVDFAPEGEPDVRIDSGLVPGGAEEPEWFVALASRHPVECDAFGLVQLPSARVLGRREVDEELAAELRAARANEARLVDRVAVLERSQLDASAKAATLDGSTARIAALEAELAGATERFERELRHVRGESESSLNRIRALSLEKQALEETLATERTAQVELAAAVARKSEELTHLRATASPPEDEEIARLESNLKERGERVRELETDLRESERLGHELIRELAKHRGETDRAGVSGTDVLATQNARLLADLEAAGWTIQELEERLSRTATAAR